MRKSFVTTTIAILLVILAILGISPYFVGLMLHNRVEKHIALSQKNNNITIKLNDYQRHWFYSTAKINYTINIKGLGTPSKITVPVILRHGPLLEANGWHFGAGAVVINDHSDNFAGKLTSIIAFNGNIHTIAKIEHVVVDVTGNRPKTDSGQIKFNDIMLNKQISNGKLNKAQTSIGSITIKASSKESAHNLIRLQNIKANFSRKGSYIPSPQEFNLSIGNITAEITENNGKQVVLGTQDVIIKQSQSVDKTLNSTFHLSFGPSHTLSGVIKKSFLTTSLKGLDTKAIHEVSQAIKNMDPNMPKEQLEEQMSRIIFNGLAKVASKGFTYKISQLQLYMPPNLGGGAITGNATLTLLPNKLDEKTSPLLAMSGSKVEPGHLLVTGLELIPYVNITASVNLPVTFIKHHLQNYYKTQLAKLSAVGKTVSSTPEAMANEAYEAILKANLLKQDPTQSTASLNLNFAKSKLMVNGSRPELKDFKLPQVQNVTAITTTK